jgi:hypothetical protein
MSNFMAGLFGFIIGLLANWGYAMIMRLLPATLCRYPIKIDVVDVDKSFSGTLTVKIAVKIGPPGKSRALMPPLIEDLAIRLKMDKGEWINGVWHQGDIDEDYFTANRTTRAHAVLATTGNDGVMVFLSNKYLEEAYLIKDGEHLIEIQIIRVIDNKMADSKVLPLIVKGGKFESIGGKNNTS